jgi:hypothetical protein
MHLRWRHLVLPFQPLPWRLLVALPLECLSTTRASGLSQVTAAEWLHRTIRAWVRRRFRLLEG